MRQRNPLFNDRWVFEQLPNHLEFEVLQSYNAWYEDNQANLEEVEEYWARQVELVTPLKERAAVPTVRASENLRAVMMTKMRVNPLPLMQHELQGWQQE
jgi:hypothetical protein